jgi:hypothetical protein
MFTRRRKFDLPRIPPLLEKLPSSSSSSSSFYSPRFTSHSKTIIDTRSPLQDCHSFISLISLLKLFNLPKPTLLSTNSNSVNMYFAKALLVGASLAVAAVAQTTKLAFTTLPTSVTAGSSTELKWAGGDGTVSTIVLHPNGNKQR